MNWFLAHLVGDYLIQSDWMAFGKKKSSWICVIHVATYLVPFLFIGITWWQLLLIGVQHFIQDRTNIIVWFMRIKGSAKFAEAPMAPWSIIVTDNVVHLLWIAAVLRWVK